MTWSRPPKPRPMPEKPPLTWDTLHPAVVVTVKVLRFLAVLAVIGAVLYGLWQLALVSSRRYDDHPAGWMFTYVILAGIALLVLLLVVMGVWDWWDKSGSPGLKAQSRRAAERREQMRAYKDAMREREGLR